MIFTIYGADIEEGVKHSSIYNYADDTSYSVADKEIDTVVKKLEEDAEGILQFMASNGLVANPSKTEFILLNNKRKKEDEGEVVKIRVGDTEIPQSKSARLLGIDLDEDQKWKSHFWGKKGLIKTLSNNIL